MRTRISWFLHAVLRKLLYHRIYNGPVRERKSLSTAAASVVSTYFTVWHQVSPNEVQFEQDGETVAFVDPFGEQDEYLNKLFDSEQPVLEDLLAELQADDVFFDVGADLGLYSCLVGTTHPTVEVVAFEPMPDRRGKCRVNLRRNGIDAQLLEYALSSGDGKSGWLDREFPAVQTAAGDDLVKQGVIPQPDVIKIDVEGGELRALTGLGDVLRTDSCRIVYCELHPESGGRQDIGLSDEELEKVYQLLEDANFKVSELHVREDHNDQPFIKAAK